MPICTSVSISSIFLKISTQAPIVGIFQEREAGKYKLCEENPCKVGLQGDIFEHVTLTEVGSDRFHNFSEGHDQAEFVFDLFII